VSEVGGQKGQTRLEVYSFTIPGDQAVNRKGRAEIMKSRLPAVGVRSLNPGPLPQTHESGLESPKRNRHPGPGRKETGEMYVPWARMFTLLGVTGESGSQACSDRDQPRFEELRIPD